MITCLVVWIELTFHIFCGLDGLTLVKYDMKELEEDLSDPKKVSKKVTQLEDRSQRNNIHLSSLAKSINETWKDYEQKVQYVVRVMLHIRKM